MHALFVSMKAFLQVTHTPTATDWIHNPKIVASEIELDEYDEEEDYVDVINLCIDVTADTFYMVYRFNDNYIDICNIYYDKDEALLAFYSGMNEQNVNEDGEYQVIERSANGNMVSTVYVKDFREQYEWPERSTRWFLKKVFVNVDGEFEISK